MAILTKEGKKEIIRIEGTGLTQLDVAKKMHLSKTTIVAWENGKIIPKPAQFNMYCEICGFSPDQIFLPIELT